MLQTPVGWSGKGSQRHPASGVETKRVLFQAIAQIWQDDRRFLLLVVPLTIVTGIFELIGVGMLVPLIGAVLGEAGEPSAISLYVEQWFGYQPSILELIVIVSAAIMIKACFLFLQMALSISAAARHDIRIKTRIYEAAARASWGSVSSMRPSHITNMMLVEATRSQDVYPCMGQLFASMTFMIAYVILGLVVSPYLMLSVAAVGVVIVGIFFLVARVVEGKGTRLRKENERAQQRIFDGFNNLKFAKSVNLTNWVVGQYRTAASAVERTLVVLARLNAFTSSAREPAVLTGALVLLAIAYFNDQSVASMLAIVFIMYRMYGQAMTWNLAWQNIAAVAPAWRDAIAMEQSLSGATETSGDVPFEGLDSAIEFQGVRFHYPGGKAGLNGLDLRIPARSVVGIVGPSGAGKSTLLDMLCGLYRPTEGQVLVDGVAMHDFDMETYRARLSLVQQEPVLFDASIQENIRVQQPDLPAADMETAASLANAHDFIKALPAGYDSWVGERGSNLSVGQKQRIALARAFAGQPEILILDECTSALDHESENAIRRAIANVRGRFTIVIVAHRLATVEDADIIYRMEDGQAQELSREAFAELRRATG